LIFTLSGKKILFIHIPKCGGSSIEQALNDLSDEPILLEHKTSSLPHLWGQYNNDQLQHLTYKEIQRQGYCAADFDFIFSIVRNPAKRLISEINWQLSHEFFQYSFSIKNIHEQFFSNDEHRFCHYKWQYDYLDDVPENTFIAKLEDLDPLIFFLNKRYNVNIRLSMSNQSSKILTPEKLTTKAAQAFNQIVEYESLLLSNIGINY
jgi:hypothetical protein